MEHSYLNSDYCRYIDLQLFNTPQHLIWLCDYHEPNDNTQLTWNDIPEATVPDSYEKELKNLPQYYLILNHTKKCYINTKELSEIQNNKQWIIHPLPILCNSDDGYQGGGDFGKHDSRRATWCEDKLETTPLHNDIINKYKNVTTDVIFEE